MVTQITLVEFSMHLIFVMFQLSQWKRNSTIWTLFGYAQMVTSDMSPDTDPIFEILRTYWTLPLIINQTMIFVEMVHEIHETYYDFVTF
jgi:hypothetical protein